MFAAIDRFTILAGRWLASAVIEGLAGYAASVHVPPPPTNDSVIAE
jgi:hypothetical protein